MKAGNELDKLITEKVMGLKVHEHLKVCAYYDGTTETSFKVFFPSTNYNDAFLVVEKFDCIQVTKYGNQYDCKIEGFPTITAETAPLAICLAALKAVGYEQ